VLDPFVMMGAAVVTALGLPGARLRARRLLVLAGNPWGYTAEEFLGWGLVKAVLVYFAVIAFLWFTVGDLSLFLPVVPAAVTLAIHHFHLQGLSERRRVLIDRHLPYVLDLLAMSLRAGATFTQAARTLLAGSVRGPIEEELTVLLSEVDKGTPLSDALLNLTTRSDSEELALMVQAVRQGMELGTPLAGVFADQSQASRYRRTQRGERLAARLPDRLAIPTVFLMAAVLLLLFGPIIVKGTQGELL
jgi:tight adherence protein C